MNSLSFKKQLTKVFDTGGRNRKCSEAFVKTGKSIADLEKEMLNGQKLQVSIA